MCKSNIFRLERKPSQAVAQSVRMNYQIYNYIPGVDSGCHILLFFCIHFIYLLMLSYDLCVDVFEKKKVQVGKDQEKAQSEKDSHSKNRGGKKTN